MTGFNRRNWWTFLLVTVLAASVAVPTPAAAVEATSNETTENAQVGENVSATFTVSDLYTGAPKTWRLNGTTELDNVTWTVRAYGLDDRQLDARSFDGSTFRTPVRASQNVSKLEVTVTGTAPTVENYTYRPREEFALASFTRQNNGTTREIIKNWTTRHYTRESRGARRNINDARAAIEDDGGDEELEEQLQFAISAYRNENFELAIDIADDAEKAAEEPNIPVGLLSGLFLGGIAVALGTAGLRSYRTRRQDDRDWRDR